MTLMLRTFSVKWDHDNAPKKKKNVILAPYMAYAKQYLNIHNTIFRVNLKINNGKLCPDHGSELKWPLSLRKWASKDTIEN